MIGYLRGEVLDHSEGKVLLLLSGVGYSVTVPQSPSYIAFTPGKPAELFIYTHVREDMLDLYGFATKLEKELFLTLLSVNGIGPKVALGILTRVEPDQLIRAVVDGNKDSLTEIPGIGKKTAERVVMELGDKMRKKLEAGDFGSRPARAAIKAGAASQRSENGHSRVVQDARDALVGLGYREQDVSLLLQRMLSEGSSIETRAEDLVKSALRQLL